MRTRSMCRPTPHLYSYQRMLAAQSSSASAVAESSSSRITRASSVSAGVQRASAGARAATMAPAAGALDLQGYSGYYGRQLAQHNQQAASCSSAAASCSSAAAVSTVSQAKSAAASAQSVSVAASKTTAVSEKTTETLQKTSRMETTRREQSLSLEYGRASNSKAVRRAEIHAVSSAKDPRHVPLPRNVDDDISKLIADAHISPYEAKEVNGAKAAYQQGRLKVDRLQKQLDQVTASAMAYKSIYMKSASQMAKEAIMACEAEAAASKKTRKTVIESCSKQVAAA